MGHNFTSLMVEHVNKSSLPTTKSVNFESFMDEDVLLMPFELNGFLFDSTLESSTKIRDWTTEGDKLLSYTYKATALVVPRFFIVTLPSLSDYCTITLMPFAPAKIIVYYIDENRIKVGESTLNITPEMQPGIYTTGFSAFGNKTNKIKYIMIWEPVELYVCRIQCR